MTKQKSFRRESLARLILSFQGWTISVGFAFQMIIMKSECGVCIYPLQWDMITWWYIRTYRSRSWSRWAEPNLKGGLFSVCPFGIPSGVLVWHVIRISLIRNQAVNWIHLKNTAWYVFVFFRCIVNNLIVFKEQLCTLLGLNTPPSQIKKGYS